MALIKLSEEEKDKLLRERDAKQQELHNLQAKDWKGKNSSALFIAHSKDPLG